MRALKQTNVCCWSGTHTHPHVFSILVCEVWSRAESKVRDTLPDRGNCALQLHFLGGLALMRDEPFLSSALMPSAETDDQNK